MVYKEPWHTNPLPGVGALQLPFQPCPYTQPSGTSIPEGSLGGAGLTPVFHMSVSPSVNHGSVEHIPETRDRVTSWRHISTPAHLSIYRPYSQSPQGVRGKSDPRVRSLYPLHLLAEGNHTAGGGEDKGKTQRVSAIW